MRLREMAAEEILGSSYEDATAQEKRYIEEWIMAADSSAEPGSGE